jgi:response regulator RpfG family c-di-GMP phosphodiesterase
MAQTYKHTLLLVDDEASILKALKRLFRREGYQILTADGGQQALELLKETDEPVSLIISDQRMPEMNGATFLEQSIAFSPDAKRFLLTGYSDMDAVVDAVNKGKIDKYLSKPWDDTEMLLLVRETLKQVELKQENIRLTELTQRQNKELAKLNKQLEEKVDERTWALKYQNKLLKRTNNGLENSLMATIRLLLSLVESSNPKLGRYMKAVGPLARQIAETAGLDKAMQDRVEMAGLVHDIGLLGMPEGLLEKDQHTMTSNEFETYEHHPQIAALSLSSVDGLKEISAIVGAHHENLDGSGFPNGVMGDDLEIGSRILAVAADYHTVLHLWPKGVKRVLSMARRYVNNEILDTIEVGEEEMLRQAIAEKVIVAGAGQRYDGAIVKHFLESIGSDTSPQAISQLAFNLLEEGMVLVEDLRLKDGRLLLTRGTTLDAGALQSISTIGNNGMIEGAIPVRINVPVQNGEEKTP